VSIAVPALGLKRNRISVRLGQTEIAEAGWLRDLLLRESDFRVKPESGRTTGVVQIVDAQMRGR
jgi:hypothetical protein